ncbi:MAG: CoA transferase [Rhizobiaceae bacterium]|nr:CoA transferase [Rhizobiaceae bacterium]
MLNKSTSRTAHTTNTGAQEAQQVKGPLDGVRVLDLSRILAGPTCTQLLGDYGADIVKVERPGAGDDTRKWGPPFVKDAQGTDTGESAYYLCANRNKRSIAVDIASAEGAQTIAKLATKCDIFVENFKLGGLKKFGLDYQSLKEQNPALIYCSITGFGQTGPHAALPGYDLMAQGFGGIMSLTGAPDGEPMKAGVGIADVMCGMYATTAILAALRHRDLTGEGQHIDIALVDTQIAWLINEGTNYLMSDQLPKRRGNQHPNIVPYQVFETKDGHVIIAVGNDSQFARFCAILERRDLAESKTYSTNQARIENRDALIEQLHPEILKFTKNELLRTMEQSNVPCGPIHNLQEVFDSEQVAARQMRISMPHSSAGSGEVELIGNPVKFSNTPVTYNKPPPLCGEHNSEVLEEWLGDDKQE